METNLIIHESTDGINWEKIVSEKINNRTLYRMFKFKNSIYLQYSDNHIESHHNKFAIRLTPE